MNVLLYRTLKRCDGRTHDQREMSNVCWGEGCTLARLWETRTGACKAILRGHRSRIWGLTATENGTLTASGSGDGSVRIWDTARLLQGGLEPHWPNGDDDMVSQRIKNEMIVTEAREDFCVAELPGIASDIYRAKFYPRGNTLVSEGYDRWVRESYNHCKIREVAGACISIITKMLGSG